MFEQQSPGTVHVCPFGVHWPPPQTSFAQICEQQSPGFAHTKPFGSQVLPQWPSLHEWLQQSPSVMQPAPCGLHVDVPQNPLVHMPSQH